MESLGFVSLTPPSNPCTSPLSGFALTCPVLLAEGMRPSELDSGQNRAEHVTVAANGGISDTGSLGRGLPWVIPFRQHSQESEGPLEGPGAGGEAALRTCPRLLVKRFLAPLSAPGRPGVASATCHSPPACLPALTCLRNGEYLEMALVFVLSALMVFCPPA